MIKGVLTNIQFCHYGRVGFEYRNTHFYCYYRVVTVLFMIFLCKFCANGLKQKQANLSERLVFIGGPTWNRTKHLLIMSQLL